MTMKKIEDGVCPECGESVFMLARDLTEYSPCEFREGKFWPEYAHTEAYCNEGSVRFFCTACGTYFEIPEELS